MITCKVCHEDNVKSPIFETESEFHKHLRKHHVKVNEYYVRFFSRKDLYTNELLPFKNTESYFGNDFLNRKNCIDYLIGLPKEKLQEELKKIFVKRKQYKNLVYAPCQVELKSSPLPNIQFFKSNQIDYTEFCKDIGLINRYDYNIKKLEFNQGNLEIIQDTREQAPLKFDKNDSVVISGLSFGDYCCKNFFNNIFIERKSASDLISTMALTERFERELLRAKELGSYIIVVCETDLNKMLNFDKEKFLNQGIKFKPQFIFHNIKEIIQKYQNVQFLFCSNRIHTKDIIKKIFLCKNNLKDYDLQYLLERGIL